MCISNISNLISMLCGVVLGLSIAQIVIPDTTTSWLLVMMSWGTLIVQLVLELFMMRKVNKELEEISKAFEGNKDEQLRR